MNVAELLERHPFCRGLSQARVQDLVPYAHVVTFPENTVIFREGQDADTLYLVLSGRVVLEQHVPARGDVQLENLTAGDMLGLSWLFPGGQWVLRARAVEATTAVALEARSVRARMEADPSLGLALATHVIEQLYQRLERVRLQRLDVYRGDQ